jgi:short-subunit dehydrogenase
MAALETLRTELQAGPGELIPLQMDVSNTKATRETIARVDSEIGGFDLVIANAGVSQETDGRRLEWSRVEQIIQVNVLGAAATITAVLTPMVKRGAGSLVAVSSLAGKIPLPSYGAYNASKSFVSTFVESLRMDLRGSGVKLTLIHPGFVKSEMTQGNPFPMPFLLETEDAVQRMGKAIVRGDEELSFPWPLALATRVGSLLPNRLLGAVSARAKAPGDSWTNSRLPGKR